MVTSQEVDVVVNERGQARNILLPQDGQLSFATNLLQLGLTYRPSWRKLSCTPWPRTRMSVSRTWPLCESNISVARSL